MNKESLVEILNYWVYRSRTIHFERGYDNVFSLKIKELIQEYGAKTVHIAFKETNNYIFIISEFLRCLGHLINEDGIRNNEVFDIIVEYLSSTNYEIRDAALCCIELYPNIPEKREVLKNALKNEDDKFLKEFIEELISETEEYALDDKRPAMQL